MKTKKKKEIQLLLIFGLSIRIEIPSICFQAYAYMS